MPVPVSSLQSVNPSPIIELFELTLDPVLHGTTTIQDPSGNNITTIRFHNNTKDTTNQDSIVWNGNTYYRMPIEATGFKEDPKQPPRPTLTISNLAIIALNIGRDACRNFVIDDKFVGFDTRFSGNLFSITVPITEITEIYAKEQSAGAIIVWPDTIKFYFDDTVSNFGVDTFKDDLKGKFKKKPDLKLIK